MGGAGKGVPGQAGSCLLLCRLSWPTWRRSASAVVCGAPARRTPGRSCLPSATWAPSSRRSLRGLQRFTQSGSVPASSCCPGALAPSTTQLTAWSTCGPARTSATGTLGTASSAPQVASASRHCCHGAAVLGRAFSMTRAEPAERCSCKFHCTGAAEGRQSRRAGAQGCHQHLCAPHTAPSHQPRWLLWFELFFWVEGWRTQAK